MIRNKINFKGLVQGVGFRYFIYQTAVRHDLTGYVRNLPDGSVDAEVQGSEDAFAAFLTVIRRGNGLSSIRDYVITHVRTLPDECSFEIY